jgi:hypothetical protein
VRNDRLGLGGERVRRIVVIGIIRERLGRGG